MADLSMDRREFARQCALEIGRAARLAGGKEPDQDTMQLLAEDMAASSALARVPCGRVRELFAHARAHYAETPILRHLVKSWAAMSPRDEPTPAEAPRLPTPRELAHSEAQMRKLAAVRTIMAERGKMGLLLDGKTTGVVDLLKAPARTLSGELEAEEWMLPLLELDPSRGEVEATAKACTESSIAFYMRRPELPPCWGQWMAHYGF